MMSCPICTGCRKFMWSMEAVTTGQRACRMAASAPARSTRCMTFPPRTLPRPLASLGSASSEYSDCDSRTGLPSMWSGCGFRPDAQIARQIGARLVLNETIGVTHDERLFHARIFEQSLRIRQMIFLDSETHYDHSPGIAYDREAHRVGTGYLG